MEGASCEDESGALDQHLVNIKDYSQHEQSEQEEDSPFDDLENILSQDEHRATRNEYLLAERLKNLEQETTALKNNNQLLEQRVADLTADLLRFEQLANDQQDEDTVATVEKQMGEFRAGLEEYRERQGKASVEKDAEITRLRGELEKVQQERNGVEEQRNSLAEANEDLLKSNESLILEIERLENQLAESRSQVHSSRSHRPYLRSRDHVFESEVQAELEILIEKLMTELELQRNQRKRLSDEMRRMQKEALLLEKEITAKNNKIYELEMNQLKSNRRPTPTPLQHNKNIRQPRNDPNSKSDRTQSSLRAISLMELLNNEEIEDRQRLILASRLIDFYSRKISAKEFGCYQLQQLLVNNYNRGNPTLLSIRKNSGTTPVEASQQKMLYNLGQILDVLLGEYLSEVKEEDSGEEYLLNLITQIVNEKTVNLNDIYVIKQLIEDCLKNRK